MQLEDYFNFPADDDILLKGTRVGTETILYDYIHKELPPETIANTYTSLTLEQVYATILYYLHNKEALTKYLTDWIEWEREMRRIQANDPTWQKLSKIKAERRAAKGTA